MAGGELMHDSSAGDYCSGDQCLVGHQWTVECDWEPLRSEADSRCSVWHQWRAALC